MSKLAPERDAPYVNTSVLAVFEETKIPGAASIIVPAAAFVGVRETWLDAVTPEIVTESIVPVPVVKEPASAVDWVQS